MTCRKISKVTTRSLKAALKEEFVRTGEFTSDNLMSNTESEPINIVNTWVIH